MTSIILYSIAFILLLVSLVKDIGKTKKSLMIAWKSFSKMLPSAIMIMVIVGISLAVLNKEVISSLIGAKSGIFGAVLALVTGSFAMIPSFVAFPLGGALLKAGAGNMQVAAFVSTVMAVGIITLPMEIKYFNKKIAVSRALFAFAICVLFTAIIGVVM